MTFETMRVFREMGFGQHFFPAHRPYWSSKYTVDLQKQGVVCHYHPFAHTVQGISAEFSKIDLALIYRHEIANLTYDDVRKFMPAAPVIFANVDLHYLRESRTAELAGDRRMRTRAEFTKTSELAMFARADAAFVHTDIEKVLVSNEIPGLLGEVAVFPWLAEREAHATDFKTSRDVMFLGNFGHPPNIDSVLFFVKEIWPVLEKELPADVKFMIVGAKPTDEVLALASERIQVTGFVEDLTPYFDRARVFVAPLRVGAGIKGKVISAFAHGVPTVATTIAAEGIASGTSGCLLVEDGPVEFAKSVIEIYFDEKKWQDVQAAALALLDKNYSRASAKEICTRTLDAARLTWSRRMESRRRKLLEDILSGNEERPVH